MEKTTMLKSLFVATALHCVNLPALPLSLEQQLGIDYIGMTPAAIVAMEFAALEANKPTVVATSEALNAFIDRTATWHLDPRDAYAMEPPVNATPVAPGAIQPAREQLNR
jgi:hypothetical protein